MSLADKSVLDRLASILGFNVTSKLTPELGAAKVVTGAAGAHTLGAAASIVAAALITSDFYIDTIFVTAISAGLGELVLYDDDVEIARIAVVAIGAIPLPASIKVLANSVITAKYATLAGTSQTCAIKLGYHLAA